MIVGILIAINLILIFDCIRKTLLLNDIADLYGEVREELYKSKRENENLMAVIENDDKVIKEMKEGKY